MAGGEVDEAGGRRDLVLGAVMAVTVLVVVALTWATFGTRADPPPPDPATAARRFADGWIAGDRDAIVDVLVRRPGEDLDEALAAFDDLDGADLRIEVGEVEQGTGVDDGRATVVLLPELDLPDVGTWAWEATLSLERSRASWRIVWDHTAFHPALADGVHFELRRGTAPRAPILAFDGTPMTATGEVVTIGIEPRAIPDADRLAQRLATLVPETVEELRETLARRDLVDSWFYPLASVPGSRLEGIREQVAALPGIILRSGDARVGATDGFGRHVLGRTADATEEEAAQRGVEPGDTIGRGGLEEVFDVELRGGDVAEVVAVESDGDERGVVATFTDDPAEPVRTTLDAVAQQAVENALVGRSDRIAVALVGPDGGLLASASRPLNGYHRAFAGSFAPGAAAWPVTLYAAVLHNGIDASDRVACPGTTTVGGVRFDNLGGFDLGQVSLPLAVGEGCRTTIAELAGDLDEGELESAAGALGFGRMPDVPLEVAGSQWPDARDVAERAAAGAGQAQVLSSVVQLASVAAALSDGTWDEVHLLPEDAGPACEIRTNPDGSANSCPTYSRSALDLATRMEVRALLEAAGARNGFPTGTGMVAGEGNSSEGRLAWLVLVRDDLAGVVLFEGGTRQQAVDLGRRIVDELDTLRARTDTPDDEATDDQ